MSDNENMKELIDDEISKWESITNDNVDALVIELISSQVEMKFNQSIYIMFTKMKRYIYI